MNLKLNGITNASQLVTYNHIPTIVEIDSDAISAARNVLTINIRPTSNTTTMNIDNVYISFTNDINAVGNSTAYVTSLNGTPYIKAMAYYLKKAIDNTSLVNKFETSITDSTVIVKPREWGGTIGTYGGSPFTMSLSTENLNSSTSSAFNDDPLYQSKVILDIYVEDDETKQTNILANSITLPFKVELEKNYFKHGIKFDIAPILGNYTENGKIIQYNIKASYINKNGQMYEIGSLNHNYAVNGYLVNQGKLFANNIKNVNLAQNVQKGTDLGYYNNTVLYYVDGEKVSIPLLLGNKQTVSYNINYYDSANALLSTETKSVTPNTALYNIEFVPDNNLAYYMEVVLPNIGSVRYTNIKPLNYGNNKNYQTVYFFNSYGGVSFFPFTAKINEQRQTKRTLYKHSNLGLYSNTSDYSLNKIYSNNNDFTVKLTSHYMAKDGIYTLYDLLNSYEAFVFIDGKRYEVIVDKLDINETDTPNIYQATLEYNYSSNDLL